MYYIENNDKPRFLESMFKIIKIEGNKLNHWLISAYLVWDVK